MNSSHRLKDVDMDAYDDIVFPDELGPMAGMVNNHHVENVITKMYERGKVAAAIGHIVFGIVISMLVKPLLYLQNKY